VREVDDIEKRFQTSKTKKRRRRTLRRVWRECPERQNRLVPVQYCKDCLSKKECDGVKVERKEVVWRRA